MGLIRANSEPIRACEKNRISYVTTLQDSTRPLTTAMRWLYVLTYILTCFHILRPSYIHPKLLGFHKRQNPRNQILCAPAAPLSHDLGSRFRSSPTDRLPHAQFCVSTYDSRYASPPRKGPVLDGYKRDASSPQFRDLKHNIRHDVAKADQLRDFVDSKHFLQIHVACWGAQGYPILS